MKPLDDTILIPPKLKPMSKYTMKELLKLVQFGAWEIKEWNEFLDTVRKEVRKRNKEV